MSGLEAVAAFALACNVMQVVEAGYKTVGVCKRIYQTGQPDPALGDYGGQLRDISSALETQLNKTTGPLSPDDTHLRDLAARCATIANALLDQIASVSKSAGKRTIGSSIRLAIKSRLKQSDLNRWEKDLAKVQSTMETQLLVGLRQRVDANMLQNEEMDRELKYFVHQLSEGQTSLSNSILRQTREIKEEISKGFTEAEASTKTHITTELLRNDDRMQDHVSKAFDDVQVVVERHTQEESAFRAQEEAYRHLLRSLKFPEMEARRNHVSHACPNTFRWILDSQNSSSDDESDDTEDIGDDDDGNDSNGENDGDDDDDNQGSDSTSSIDTDIAVYSDSSDSPTWDSLAEWLRSSEPVYWVSGKPGSGKSALMKFILSHEQTKLLLKQWQDGVCILSHFFWRPGTELQQSIKGLLCSLLHQTFIQDKDRALSYLETQPELLWKDSSSDWDLKELQDLFIDNLRRPSAAFCLFIDGLDEVWPKDGVHDLILLLNTLLQKTKHLKLCVSSRREHLLEARLNKYPQLKMQDLIRNDLKKYATQTLREASAHANLYGGTIRHMIAQIVQASDGVFLWVVLVSNSLSRGIQNGDSIKELFQRLHSLPRDLGGLYLDMWLRQNEYDEIYQKSSKKLLYLCLVALGWKEKRGDWPYLEVFQLMAAIDDEVLEDLLGDRQYPFEELRRRFQSTANMIRLRSAGLLEVYGASQYVPSYNELFNHPVRFIHRSALDFLTGTEQGRAFWTDHGMTYDLAYTRLYLASLARPNYPASLPSAHLRMHLMILANNHKSLEPSTIHHCLRETAKWWHHFRTYPGRPDFLMEASRFGFFNYVSERLSAEQNESSTIPRLFLHSTCTHGWVGMFFVAFQRAGRNVIDGQCRLLCLFLDKVAFRDPKPFILPPVGNGGPCHSISQTLAHFLLFIRNTLNTIGPVFAQVFLNTLEAFKGTPVDLTGKLLLNLEAMTISSESFFLTIVDPGVPLKNPRTERVQVEISLGDWVDGTRDRLLALVDRSHPITRDKSCTPRVRFISSITWNTAKELCKHTPNESDVNHLSHMAEDLLYLSFLRSFRSLLPGPRPSSTVFLNEVASLREGWAKSVLKPVYVTNPRTGRLILG